MHSQAHGHLTKQKSWWQTFNVNISLFIYSIYLKWQSVTFAILVSNKHFRLFYVNMLKNKTKKNIQIQITPWTTKPFMRKIAVFENHKNVRKHAQRLCSLLSALWEWPIRIDPLEFPLSGSSSPHDVITVVKQ